MSNGYFMQSSVGKLFVKFRRHSLRQESRLAPAAPSASAREIIRFTSDDV